MIVKLAIKVRPGARGDGLLAREADGTLKLQVAAPAEDGRANRAVEALLADVVGLPKRAVKVVQGESSRRKVVAFEGLERDQIDARIDAVLAKAGA